MRVSVLDSPVKHVLLEAHEGAKSDQDVLRQLRNRYDIGGGCSQGQMLYVNLPLTSRDEADESAQYERFGRRMAEMLKDACKACRTDVDLASAVEIAVGCGVAMEQVYSRELHGEVPDVAEGDSIVVWDDNGSVS